MSEPIKNRGRASQIIDFTGITYGKISPTDIDGLIEYHDKAVILFEMKYENAVMPWGQQTALERICDDIRHAGKESVVFICSHSVWNYHEDVKAAETIVKAVYWHGKWRGITEGKTLNEWVTKYLKWVDDNPVCM